MAKQEQDPLVDSMNRLAVAGWGYTEVALVKLGLEPDERKELMGENVRLMAKHARRFVAELDKHGL